MSVIRPPFQLRITGDEVTAKRFVGYATQLFHNLCDRMGLGTDVKTMTETYDLDPLGEITGHIVVYRSFDVNIVTIHAEIPEEEEREVGRVVWEPWNGNMENICTDHLWEFAMRTGLYSYPLYFHSTVTDYFGASPQPGNGYPGIPPLTNPSLCNLDYTWGDSPPAVNTLYWPAIEGGYLKCRFRPERAPASYYNGFSIIWDNRTTGGSPGDPINPYTNAGAVTCELSVVVSTDHDPGYGFSEPGHVILSSSLAFYLTDAVGNYFVWYIGIDDLLYNDSGYIPPGDRPYVDTLGDAFGGGAKGVFLITLADFGFTADIVRVGFQAGYPGNMRGKDDPVGRDMLLTCDYIDFY